MRRFTDIMNLSFVEGDPNDFAKFLDARTPNYDDGMTRWQLDQPRPGRGKYGSVDTTTLMVSVITSATVAAVANGLVSIVRDYLAHVLSARDLKIKSQLERTRIVVSVGDRRVEVEKSSSETVWRDILSALLKELAQQGTAGGIVESPSDNQEHQHD